MNFENVKKVKRSKAFTALDAILTAVIAVAIGLSIWLIYRTPSKTVTITAPNYERSFPLDVDADIELEHLTVHIKSGKVWVTDADCGDKTCVHTGAISRSGQSIVCLPNGIVISVSGEDDLHWEIGR